MSDKKACDPAFSEVSAIPILAPSEVPVRPKYKKAGPPFNPGIYTAYNEGTHFGPCFAIQLTIDEQGLIQDSILLNHDTNEIENEGVFAFDLVSYLLTMNPSVSESGVGADDVVANLIIPITIEETGSIVDEATDA